MTRSPGLLIHGRRRVLNAAMAVAMLASLLPLASTLAAADHFQASLEWPPGGWVAGTTHYAWVHARNSDGSIDYDYRGTVHLTSSDPLATLPADYTFTAADSGYHTGFPVVLRTAGNQSVIVTDVTNPSITGTSDATAVVAAAAAGLAWVSFPLSGTAGAAFASDIRVRLVDAYGNTVMTAGRAVDLELWTVAPGVTGTLTCTGGTTQSTTVTGIATFSGCSINNPGRFELRVYSGSLTPATGAYITISAAPTTATLQLRAEPATITYPGATTLTMAFSSGGAGTTIGLFWTLPGSDSWNRVTTLTAGSGGDVSYSDTPVYIVDYRAVCEAGCPGGVSTIESNRVTVSVRYSITLSPSTAGVAVVRARTRVTYTARAQPTHSTPTQVRFSVYQKVRGAWVLKYQRTVAANSSGVVRFGRTWSTRGDWYVRARALTDTYNLLKDSPIVRVRVT